jgi:hypothetical protein
MKKFAASLGCRHAASVSLGAAAAQAITTAPKAGSRAPPMNPDPSVAWVMAAGFLGLVVLRRTRSGPMN